MANVKTTLTKLSEIDGVVGACIVDYTSGMALGKIGGGVDLELAAAGNSEVVKAKLKTMKSLSIKGDIEDILITLANQIHIIRPSVKNTGIFVYVVLDRNKCNLALARRNVQTAEGAFEVV